MVRISDDMDPALDQRWTYRSRHSRRFRVRPARKKRAAAGLRQRQATCSTARPRGVWERLEAFIIEWTCAGLRLGALVDTLHSFGRCVSVLRFLVRAREPSRVFGWQLAFLRHEIQLALARHGLQILLRAGRLRGWLFSDAD